MTTFTTAKKLIKQTWITGCRSTTLELHLALMFLCVTLIIITLINIYNGTANIRVDLFFVALAVAFGTNSFYCCLFLRRNTETQNKLNIKITVRKTIIETCLFSGVAFLLFLNYELSLFLQRREQGPILPYIPLLTFAVFIFKSWKARYLYLIILFLTALILGSIKIAELESLAGANTNTFVST